MAEVDVGAETYFSYADLDTADIYAGAAIHATNWAAALDDAKGQALASATRLLDRQDWQGERFSSSQPGDWPRTGVYDAEGNLIAPADVDDYPQEIIDACIELAISMIDGTDPQGSATTEDLTKRLKAGSVEIENFRGKASSATRFPQIVHELVSRWLDGYGSPLTGVATGTDAESAFENGYGYDQGI